jgi:hypothetical protein
VFFFAENLFEINHTLTGWNGNFKAWRKKIDISDDDSPVRHPSEYWNYSRLRCTGKGFGQSILAAETFVGFIVLTNG